MMTREDRQEALSLAYIHAVAAMCGMTHSTRSKDYGLDLTLHEVLGDETGYTESGLTLDVQLKSTIHAIQTRRSIRYDLPIRSFDVLRMGSAVRRILVLLVLPTQETDWLRQSRNKLELRHGLYWTSLRDRLPTTNRVSIRLEIPKNQVFTVQGLREIMDRIRRGEELT